MGEPVASWTCDRGAVSVSSAGRGGPPPGAAPLQDPIFVARKPEAEVRFRDRETGQIEKERIFLEGYLRFLYGGGPLRRLLVGLFLARGPASHLWGVLRRSPRSRLRIAGFVSSLGIDAGEAERPLESYRSLDAFFARRLRPGARPIDRTPEHLVAPCDGRLLVAPRLEGVTLRVKGASLDAAELLGDGGLARRFEGGTAFVIRLAPADYHRFHFPDGGMASPPRRLGGPLHSVHLIAVEAGAPIFRNKRVVTTIRSDNFGEIAMVEVGALLVGRIEETYIPGRVERGDEKGCFRFGGSTIVLLLEPGRIVCDDDLVRWSALPSAEAPDRTPIETFVRLGTRLGKRPAAQS